MPDASLSQTIEAEREAVVAAQLAQNTSDWSNAIAALAAARAATDEAVRKVEARTAELERDLRTARTLLNDVGHE